jgi:hypothetical protein
MKRLVICTVEVNRGNIRRECSTSAVNKTYMKKGILLKIDSSKVCAKPHATFTSSEHNTMLRRLTKAVNFLARCAAINCLRRPEGVWCPQEDKTRQCRKITEEDTNRVSKLMNVLSTIQFPSPTSLRQ